MTDRSIGGAPFAARRGSPSRLRATSVATDARDVLYGESFAATVKHVFRSTVNVEPSAPASLPVVGLLRAGPGNLPGCVLVEAEDGFDWTRTGVRPGAPVARDGGLLLLGDAVVLDLSTATLWSSGGQLAGPFVAPAEMRTRLAELGAAAVAREAKGLGCLHRHRASLLSGDLAGSQDLDPLARASARRLIALLAALRSGSPADAVAAALRLVGLGIGLTPSGDDVLVGLFGAMHLAAQALGERRPDDAVRSQLAALLPGRTSAVSELFLGAALRGETSESLRRFVAGIVSAAPPPASEVEGLLSYGGSSGVEIALGALVGVELLLGADATE